MNKEELKADLDGIKELVRSAIEVGEVGELDTAKNRLVTALNGLESAVNNVDSIPQELVPEQGQYFYIAYADYDTKDDGTHYANIESLYLYKTKAEQAQALGFIGLRSGSNLKILCADTQNYCWGTTQWGNNDTD